MLYDVYAHTMGMIEELEKHESNETGVSLENSGLLRHIIPNWRHHNMMPKDEVSAKAVFFFFHEGSLSDAVYHK